jgi:hypothetical protein
MAMNWFASLPSILVSTTVATAVGVLGGFGTLEVEANPIPIRVIRVNSRSAEISAKVGRLLSIEPEVEPVAIANLSEHHPFANVNLVVPKSVTKSATKPAFIAQLGIAPDYLILVASRMWDCGDYLNCCNYSLFTPL